MSRLRFSNQVVLFAILSFAVVSFGSIPDAWTLRPGLSRTESDSQLPPLNGYTNEAVSDRITTLPGLKTEFNTLPFEQFSGYLEVDATAGRHLFYWFVEAENNPETAPVLIWTNGGPGCSGLIGFLTEQGPYRPTKEGEFLAMNQYNWNKVANIFFIEQPAGVGFSYSEDTNDYQTVGDERAAEDNYRAIVQFFKRFPQYKGNDFYLSSESYGGHYIPMLAKRVVEGNKVAAPEEHVNLKGFLVGNPYTNPDENIIGMVGAFWGRQLTPKPLADRWFKECVLKTHICPNWDTECDPHSRHIENPEELHECLRLEQTIKNSAGNLNHYGLDWPVCNNPLWPSVGRASLLQGNGADNSLAASMPEYASLSQGEALLQMLEDSRYEGIREESPKEEEANSLTAQNSGPKIVPCQESYATAYLNRKDVQDAIHVLPKAMEGRKWHECTNRHHIHYNKTDSAVDMSPYYKWLIDGGYGLDILVYSGDADSVCGTQGTQTWIYDLEYPVTSDWQQWLLNEQVAGYITKFQGFTFMTVHNAGHEVPTYQPKVALEMLKGFLSKSL